jgi:hypothetical protein
VTSPIAREGESAEEIAVRIVKDCFTDLQVGDNLCECFRTEIAKVITAAFSERDELRHHLGVAVMLAREFGQTGYVNIWSQLLHSDFASNTSTAVAKMAAALSRAEAAEKALGEAVPIITAMVDNIEAWEIFCIERSLPEPADSELANVTLGQVRALRALLPRESGDWRSAASPALSDPVVWRCFHCDEVFTTPETAREHFGVDADYEPGCTAKLTEGDKAFEREIARLQAELERYDAEDSDKDREFHARRADHATALIRAEEAGYAKGVADMKAQGYCVEPSDHDHHYYPAALADPVGPKP